MGQLTDRNEDMHVTAPRFEWKWTAGNLLSLLNLFVLVAGGGWFASAIDSRVGYSETAIDAIQADIRRLETTGRTLDNHELRLTRVEDQASSAASAMRTVEASLNALASDIRVTREIVQRIENAQNGSQPRQ